METLFSPALDPQTATLADAAWARLRHDIVTGTRVPGERLRIDRMRQLYGIGASPLREALQRLSAEGLVIAEGNRGFTVAPLDPDEFADLTRARIAVERESLRLSLTLGDSAWEADVVSAAYLMSKADQELKPGTDAWEKANTTFHSAMVSACGSTWLLRVRDGLHTLAERYRRASVEKSGRQRNLREEHREIADAVLRRDIEGACALTAAHYGKTETELRSVRTK